RSVSATVNNANPKRYAVNQDGKIVKSMDSNYTKGQTIQLYFSNEAKNDQGSVTFYYVDSQTVDGQQCAIYVVSTDVTPSATVPSQADWYKQAQSDQKAIQDAYNNRALKYIVVSPKSKRVQRSTTHIRRVLRLKRFILRQPRRKSSTVRSTSH